MTCREQGQFSRAVCGRGPSVTSCGGRGFVAVSEREESIGHVGALDGCYNTVSERRD
jgi:hypothetical protein